MRPALALLFAVLFAFPAQAAVLGDVNADGQVDLTEAVYALRAAAGLPVQGPTPEEQEELEQVANSVAMALGESYSAVASMEEVNEVLEYLGLSTIDSDTAAAAFQDILNALQAVNECVDWSSSLPQKTVTITFVSTPNCYTLTGSLTVTVVTATTEAITYHVQYNNLTYDGCTINGSSTVTVTNNGTQVTIKQEPENLTVCGTLLNGVISLTYDVATLTLVSASVKGTSVFTEGEVTTTVVVDLTYTPTGGFSGTLTVTEGDQTYECTATNLVLSSECGIPTSGTLTIDEITLDFSETTCENPTVIVMVRGFPVTLSLEEAIALFTTP